VCRPIVIDYTIPLPINGLTTKEEVLRIDKLGSPNGLKDRTFRAVFDMPVAPFNHNLFKIGKRQYRNPVCLAQEWHKAIEDGKYASPAALARHLKVSRARVTQIMSLLKLSSEVIQMVSSLGDPLVSPKLTERRLRPLLGMIAEKQMERITIILSR